MAPGRIARGLGGQTRFMSSDDTENRTPAQASRAADASDDMEQRLEQLDEHIDDAKQKADDQAQPQASADDDVVDDVAGGGTDNTDEADDPEGPIVAE